MIKRGTKFKNHPISFQLARISEYVIFILIVQVYSSLFRTTILIHAQEVPASLAQLASLNLDINQNQTDGFGQRDLSIERASLNSSLIALKLSSEARSSLTDGAFDSAHDLTQLKTNFGASTTGKQLRKLLRKPGLILSSFVPHILSKQLVLKRPDQQSGPLGLRRLNEKLLTSKQRPVSSGRPSGVMVPYNFQPVRVIPDHLMAVGHLRPLLLGPLQQPDMAQQVKLHAGNNPDRIVFLQRLHPTTQSLASRVPVRPQPLDETVAGEPTQTRPAFVSLIEEDEPEEEELQDGSESTESHDPIPSTKSDTTETGLNQMDQLIKGEYENRLNLNHQILSMNFGNYTSGPAQEPGEDYPTGSTSSPIERGPLLTSTLSSWPTFEQPTTQAESPWWVSSQHSVNQLTQSDPRRHRSMLNSSAVRTPVATISTNGSENRIAAESTSSQQMVDEAGNDRPFVVPLRVGQRQQAPFKPTAPETISQLKHNNQQLSNHSSSRQHEQLKQMAGSQVKLTAGTVRTTLAPDNFHQLRNLRLQSSSSSGNSNNDNNNDNNNNEHHHRESDDRKRPWESQTTTSRPTDSVLAVTSVPMTSALEPLPIDQLRWRDTAKQGDRKSSATSLHSLGDTLRRLRETKKRIRQLQAELNGTSAGLTSSASIGNKPQRVNDHSTADMDDEYESPADDEELAGELLLSSPWTQKQRNSSSAGELLFERWSAGKLNSAPGEPLVRAQHALNLPLALYHGSPLTAPARLVVSALGQGGHHLGRAEPARWPLTAVQVPSSRPIVLGSTLKVSDEPRLTSATTRQASSTTTPMPSFYAPADKSSLTASGKNPKEVMNGTHREQLTRPSPSGELGRQATTGSSYLQAATSHRTRPAHPHGQAEQTDASLARRQPISSLIETANNDNNRQTDTMRLATKRPILPSTADSTTTTATTSSKQSQVATTTPTSLDTVSSSESMTAKQRKQTPTRPGVRLPTPVDQLADARATNASGNQVARNKSLSRLDLLDPGDGWHQLGAEKPTANQSHPVVGPEANETANMLERMFTFLAGSGPASLDRVSGGSGLQVRLLANSSNELADDKLALADDRLTTERVLQWLIGFSCTLALICLCVIVALLRCRSANSRSTSASASSSRILVAAKQQQPGSSASTDWRRKLTCATQAGHEQRRDQLILDGTMRNVSLLASQHLVAQNLSPGLLNERLYPGKSAGLASISLPQPRFNRTCCHCVNCSESWLFRDTPTDKTGSRANPTLCPSGFYHPAPRGKLPFGAASSVNKFLNLCKIQAQSDGLKSQDSAKVSPSISSQRQPISGTRMRMMSAIDERPTKQRCPAGCECLGTSETGASRANEHEPSVSDEQQQQQQQQQQQHLSCTGGESCRQASRRPEQRSDVAKLADRCSACGESMFSPGDNLADEPAVQAADNLCKFCDPTELVGCRAEPGLSDCSIGSGSNASSLVELPPPAHSGAISGSVAAASACSKLYRANRAPTSSHHADLNYSQFRQSRDKFSRGVSSRNTSSGAKHDQSATSAKSRAQAFRPHEHKGFRDQHQQVDGRADRVAGPDKLLLQAEQQAS